MVALQQMSLEDHLALYVAVCPTESYLQSPKKGKKSKVGTTSDLVGGGTLGGRIEVKVWAQNVG